MQSLSAVFKSSKEQRKEEKRIKERKKKKDQHQRWIDPGNKAGAVLSIVLFQFIFFEKHKLYFIDNESLYL